MPLCAKIELEIAKDRRALGCDVAEGERHVRHHVAHQMRLAARSLTLEVADRRLGGAQQQIARMVGQDTVQLLGHRPVE